VSSFLLPLTLLLWLSVAALAQQQPLDPALLVNKTHAERTVILSDHYINGIRYLDSTAVFAHIAAVRQLAEQHDDQDLMLEAALMRAHYFYYRESFGQEVVLPMLDSLRDMAEHEDVWWLRIRAENLIGHYHFSYLDNYEQGFTHFARTVRMMQPLTNLEFPLKRACLYHVALAHYRFRDHAKVVEYLRMALAERPMQGVEAYSETMLNTMGLSFRQLGMMDSSDHYFNQTQRLATSTGHPEWVGIAMGNLGSNHHQRGEYDKASALLDSAVAIAQEFGDHGLLAGDLCLLADISFRTGDLAKARAYVAQARTAAYLSEDFGRLKPLYPLLAKLHAADGDHGMAAMFIDSALFVRDSLDRAFSAMKLTRAEQKVELEHIEAEAQAVRVRRNAILCGLALVMVIALLLVNRQRARAKARQLALEAAAMRAENELLMARQELSDFTRTMQDKNRQLEETQEALDQLKGGQDAERDQAVRTLSEAVLLTDRDWREFTALFERVHPGFFARLTEKLPGLSEAETRFMALTRLNLSGKEMAAMLGVSLEAIRQLRLRIRRKPMVGEDADLVQLVMGM